MTKNTFRTIIAPKAVIDEIEEYGRIHGCPSNSQALARLLNDAKAHDSLANQVEGLNNLVLKLIDKIPDAPKQEVPH